MFKHAILALSLAMFVSMGAAAAAAEHDCCCGKDAKCCQSATEHKCCGDDGQKCGCCDHNGEHGSHSDPDVHGGHHA